MTISMRHPAPGSSVIQNTSSAVLDSGSEAGMTIMLISMDASFRSRIIHDPEYE